MSHPTSGWTCISMFQHMFANCFDFLICFTGALADPKDTITVHAEDLDSTTYVFPTLGHGDSSVDDAWEKL